MSSTPYYLTTPIYYVNDVPHIGHAYTTILGDVLARTHRLLGDPTWYLTGTDEHGQKVQQAAAAAGRSPREQADATVVRFQDLWKRLEITHDDFIRTTEPRHVRTVQGLLQDLHDRGEIYRAEYDGWYCVPCERFFTEKDLADGQTCPACQRPVQRIREANYFFRMSAYQAWLVDYIETHPEFIQPDFRRNETLGFLRKPLQDLCISRPKSRLSWGIELPFDADFVCYVWFDALVNYISAVGYPAEPERFARWWPASAHLIGKDILTTHTVYWPTMLRAAGLPMPRTIFAHGWWLVGDTKMSKSLGNVVNPMDMIDRYGVDPFRYFLVAEMTLGQDAHFSEAAFVRRYNSDLANDLGNLLSRVLKMIDSYCGGVVPAPGPDAGAEEEGLGRQFREAAGAMRAALAGFHLDRGLAAALAAVRATNRYLESRAPWTQAKQTDRGPLHTTLYTAAEALRAASALFHPVMPGRMADARRALGCATETPAPEELEAWGVLPPGAAITVGAPLFPRIQGPDDAAPAPSKVRMTSAAAPAASSPAAANTEPKAAAPASKKKAAPAGPAEQVTYDEFARLDLRTARILAAERVEGADKLLKLQLDVGGTPRQIVAGIAKAYAPEALIGQTIVVVANLAPARIRGVESNGMLLAATAGEALGLVRPDGDLPSGARVK
jgi:methionyl-tRNA synthetase